MTKIFECFKCGKHFDFGNDADGIPNGINLILCDGRELTLCSACVGSMNTKEGQRWLKQFKEGDLPHDESR